MVVVKLGGSLYQATELQHWLTTLKKCSQQQNIIIVPGGGPFADQVRQAQQLHGFNDSDAHHMAILAMAQFGILLSSLLPDCHPFSFPSEHPATSYPLSIWLPDKQLLDQPGIAQNWDITSDSLALWLAQQCQVEKLTLIKRQPPEQISSIGQLNKIGFIDNGFVRLMSQHPIPTEVIAADHYQQFTLDLPKSPLQS
jgi:aspartokinase-like uncharacterized kinase